MRTGFSGIVNICGRLETDSYLVTRPLFHKEKEGKGREAKQIIYWQKQKQQIRDRRRKKNKSVDLWTDLSQEGFVGGVLLLPLLFLCALILWQLVGTGHGGLQGHGRGTWPVYDGGVAADGAAGVRLVAPRRVGASLGPDLNREQVKNVRRDLRRRICWAKLCASFS